MDEAEIAAHGNAVHACLCKILQMKKRRLVILFCLLVLLANGVVAWLLPAGPGGRWVSVRLKEEDWFLRGSLAALGVIDAQKAKASQPRLYFIGSSQLGFAIDFNKVIEAMPSGVVIPISVPDMDVVKCAFLMCRLPLERGDRVFLLLSERDFRATETINAAWMRPFASWAGCKFLVSISGMRGMAQYWRPFIDLVMATSFPIWRNRDYLELLLTRLVVDPTRGIATYSQKEAERGISRWQESLSMKGDAALLVARHEVALRTLAADLRACDIHVCIMGSDINPAYATPESYALRGHVMDVIGRLQKEKLCEYIDMNQMDLGIGPQDWLDGTHLNEKGQAKYTDHLIEAIQNISN